VRIEDVPQDDENFYDGHRRAVYAAGPQGNYVQTHSKGWKVETFFTAMAIAALDDESKSMLDRVRKGELSPLALHMARRQMTPKLLAQHVGLFAFQVRRHLKPSVFARLSAGIKQRYARALAVSLHDLMRVPEA
jgi:hypothetical protein